MTKPNAFPVVDCHNFIGEPWGTRERQTATELVKKMDANAIEKAVVFCFPYRNYDNEYTARASQEFADRLIPFAMIAPTYEDNPKDTFRRYVEEKGFQGLALYAAAHDYKMTKTGLLKPLFELCEQYRLPVVAYSGDEIYSDPLHFIDIAQLFPKVNIVMLHSGHMLQISEAIDIAKRYPNIYLEHASGISTKVTTSIEALGAERVIMGTGTPYWDFEVQLKKLEVAIEDEQVRAKVMGGNFLRLLGN